ncbi:ZIP family metal transporter [Candidatus Kaiserbacteria bacterium]|nr:ZIP family metal transporter [Candidatus Kaiserbacteria bacterium]USN92591.1 MAG: ZIP family metal transporter [Candidatus Nomurabacteria bacterium]
MIFESIIASVCVAVVSLVGVFFFGNNKRLIGSQKYVVPLAVGVFLSLVLFELIPETLELSPSFGGIAVAFGFIVFYVLANVLHKRHHDLEEEECDRKGVASLLLIGDAVHNVADGVVLGGAFLIDPSIGVATAIGLALHEIPQEIVEFGVLIRAGYSRTKAALYNLISASSIVLGALLINLLAQHAEEYVWVITGVAAGNLLFLAASDLLPRIHGNLKNYGSIWHSSICIVLGFTIMTTVLTWTHNHFGHGYATEEKTEEHTYGH